MTTKIAYSKGLADIQSITCNGGPFINVTRFKYAILEKIEEIAFCKNNNHLNFDDWNKGKLFGMTSELKWIKRNNTFHTVVITDGELPDNFTLYGELYPLGEEPVKHIYLWGEKDDDVKGWYDPKIPKIFNYPVDDFKNIPKRLKVKILQYQLSEEYEVFRNGNMKKEIRESLIHRIVDLEGE